MAKIEKASIAFSFPKDLNGRIKSELPQADNRDRQVEIKPAL